jgi:phosphoglycolate phosphatase-like HAD superfamily hydrolase
VNLAIFDIDGTLTETDQIDEICFVQALADALGITGISTNWAGYPHTTDSAITLHVFQERFNRPPEEIELLKFKTRFVSLLEDHRLNDPSLFAEIVGASCMLGRLNQEPGWRVAIASGSWSVSAALKLKVAGIGLDDFPAAFADDGHSREEILKSAVLKAQLHYQENHFARIVSVGDGLWDVRTARNLRFPFVGIGSEKRGKTLRRAGATHVIRDFTNYSEVISCLAKADVPKTEGHRSRERHAPAI